MAAAITASMLTSLVSAVGSHHVTTDPDVLAGRSVDHTGRYRGRASALVRPGSAEEVAEVLRVCRDAGAYVTVQGGRTSLVAGTVPEHDDVLLSTERLCVVSDVDTVERRIEIGAGVTLAAVQHAASTAGLVFGVDLSARDTATVGGMASTNAGGLRTVRYGNMGEQVVGLDVALPDGTVLRRHSRVRRDNTGYDLPVRRGRRHPGGYHRAGSAAAPHPVASGDSRVRVRRAGSAGRCRPNVPRRGGHRGVGID